MISQVSGPAVGIAVRVATRGTAQLALGGPGLDLLPGVGPPPLQLGAGRITLPLSPDAGGELFDVLTGHAGRGGRGAFLGRGQSGPQLSCVSSGLFGLLGPPLRNGTRLTPPLSLSTRTLGISTQRPQGGRTNNTKHSLLSSQEEAGPAVGPA